MFIIKQDPQNDRAELLGHRQKGFTTVLKVDFRLKKKSKNANDKSSKEETSGALTKYLKVKFCLHQNKEAEKRGVS